MGRGRTWARSFPQHHVAGRMRTHAGTRVCTHLPASRCCGGLSDVKRCSMSVSGMFGQQSCGKTSFSTIAGCRLFVGECFARTHALVALPPLFQMNEPNRVDQSQLGLPIRVETEWWFNMTRTGYSARVVFASLPVQGCRELPGTADTRPLGLGRCKRRPVQRGFRYIYCAIHAYSRTSACQCNPALVAVRSICVGLH